MRRNPYSVILLDEIEKAHPDIFNVLLQVLDDGRLTDAQGRTVDFSNTLILMTSNLGSQYLASRTGSLGFASANAQSERSDIRAKVMGKVREFVRPEFLNRLDEVLLFSKLSEEEIAQIVTLVLGETRSYLSDQKLQLKVTDAPPAGWQPRATIRSSAPAHCAVWCSARFTTRSRICWSLTNWARATPFWSMSSTGNCRSARISRWRPPPPPNTSGSNPNAVASC